MNHLTDFQLNEYLDNTLDTSTRREVDAHLQTCEDCSAHLVELKDVFTILKTLPEVKLRRDLSSAILARLPQKQTRLWTSSLAAQLGAALGVFIWFSMQVANFIIPIISAFRFPQFTMPSFQFTVPDFQFSNLYSLFSIPKFQLPPFDFPTFQLSTFNLAFIAISIFLLWLVGNLSLLHDRSGVQK